MAANTEELLELMPAVATNGKMSCDVSGSQPALSGEKTSEKIGRRKSSTGSILKLKAVYNAVKYTGRNSGNPSPSSSRTNTPVVKKKVPLRKRSCKRNLSKMLNHDALCNCKICAGWIDKHVGETSPNQNSLDSTDAVQLAANGKVSQLADLCNADPDRLMACDRKGATVLHHAAVAEQTKVMNYILSHPNGQELLSATDDLKATPLHWAVFKDSALSVDYLLSVGADPTLRDNSGLPSLHLAVKCNSLRSLKVLIDRKVDVNLRGSANNTALHIGAQTDHVEAFKLLMDAGAKPCLPCSQGYRPLHVAAAVGSRKVMQLILSHGEKWGYTASQLLTFGDKERSSPLHTAVTGGNICSIKLCLEFGARLDTKQSDDSTPLHMVCGQGNLEIVRLMFDLAPDQAKTCLSILDKQEQSPLHKAAMFNHPPIIDYLIEKGANIEIMDAEERTPLMLAAYRESWDSVRALLGHGADIMVKDMEERNLMHVIILKGGDICNLAESKAKKEYMTSVCEMFHKTDTQHLMSQPDSNGCSPLHYACQQGNLPSLKLLMSFGVSALLKTCKKQSALHFASMYGRFNACCRLLDSHQGPNIINEKDENGMTSLHFAALHGHVKVVQLLLNRGAILHRNVKGESVLHVVASSGYTKTIRMLVETHFHLIDQVEGDGNTALHLAAKAGHVTSVELLLELNATILRNIAGETCLTEAIIDQNREVALAIVHHKRWEEAMNVFQKHGKVIYPPFLLLIQQLPDVTVAVLGRCKETADVDKRSEDYWIRFHFKYLQPPLTIRDELIKSMKKVKNGKHNHSQDGATEKEREEFETLFPYEESCLALPALNKMVEFNRVECLRHPVTLAYLRQKWNAYGRLFHSLNLLFYMLNLFPVTYLVCTINSGLHIENNHVPVNIVNGSANAVGDFPVYYSTFQVAMIILLIVVNVLQMGKECVQMFQQKLAYFLDIANAMEWLLYSTSVLYAVPFLTGYPTHWQFEMGAVAVFMAWFNLLNFLQKFDIAGIYVVMFLHILKTLVKVLLVFSFLIIAFALAFTVLMQNEADKAFSNPALSIMRIITMLLGEISYIEKFLEPFVDGNPNTFHYSTPSFILLILFIVVMPILLMNLLIGLAVGDIAQVQSNAVLQRLAMQVNHHTSIESRLPTSFLKRVDKAYVTLYPNRFGGKVAQAWGQLFKHTGIQSNYGEEENADTESNTSVLQLELTKQKERIKNIQSCLDQQHNLLRLIVQKMEIKSEAEDQDEGSSPVVSTSKHAVLSTLPGSSGSKLMAMRALKSFAK